MPDYRQVWRAIVDSDDPATMVREHLVFLTESAECHRLLDDLMANFVAARIDEDALELVFRYAEYDDECVISCDPPYQGADSDAPPSVLDVVKVHNGIGWECLGGGGLGFWGIQDGTFVGGGGWEYAALTEAASANREFLDQLTLAGLTPKDVISPCEYGQNWLIWHPAEKNLRGEPALYFVSHGDCVATPVAGARDLAFGPLLLRVMVQDILGREIFDEVYT